MDLCFYNINLRWHCLLAVRVWNTATPPKLAFFAKLMAVSWCIFSPSGKGLSMAGICKFYKWITTVTKFFSRLGQFGNFWFEYNSKINLKCLSFETSLASSKAGIWASKNSKGNMFMFIFERWIYFLSFWLCLNGRQTHFCRLSSSYWCNIRRIISVKHGRIQGSRTWTPLSSSAALRKATYVNSLLLLQLHSPFLCSSALSMDYLSSVYPFVYVWMNSQTVSNPSQQSKAECIAAELDH